MPFPISRRELVRRAAALRRAAAALARLARGSAPGGGGEAPAPSPPAGEAEAAFLENVRDTLRDLSDGPAGAPPAPRPPGASARLRAGLPRAARLLERVRRHEDVVLAVALLAGIAMMILHWVR